MSAAFGPFREAVFERGPRTAIVLGSGLGTMAGAFRESIAVPFHDVPGLCATSVGGHSGKLALGEWHGAAVLVFFGRVHFYEGHSWDAVTAPVRLAASFGSKRVVLTNAAGGIHPSLNPGSLMAIRGHLALLERDAWRSHSIGTPYSGRLVKHLHDAGLHAGVYASLTGPSYETPAEIRAYASLGVDAVGMSTAREAEAAVELGLEVVAISCITNRAAGLADGLLAHAEVLTNAKLAVDRLGALIGGLAAMP